MSSEPQEASSASATSAAEQAKPRIKIGTQREGVALPRVPPRVKTIFTTPDPVEASAAAPPQASPLESSLQAAPPPVEPAAAPHPGPLPEGEGEAEFYSHGAPTETEPVDDLAPKPAALAHTKKTAKFVVERTAGAKIPLPNLRAEMPEDLAQEVEAALAGVSLNEMIAGQGDDAQAGVALEPEARVRGRILRVQQDDVFLDLGGRNQGVVSARQFSAPPEPGAVVEAVVTRFNADEGLYELTVPGGAVEVGDWSQVTEGMIVEVVVTGHNKGGLECDVSKLRGFIPLSQIAPFRVEQPEQFVGQKLKCVVSEVDPERRKLVLSRRAAVEREQAEAREKLLAELAPGQIHEGIVRNIRDFGAFVDLGGVDGLLHVGQISWDRIKHPSDVLQVGQKIRVKIDRIQPDTGKISLSHRDLLESPWANVTTKYPVTSRVKGTVSKLMDFGAFVRLESGVEGLIHISELAHGRVLRASDVVAEGQEVEVKVLSVDAEAQRISLSLRALQDRPEPQKKGAPEPEEPDPPPPPPRKSNAPLKGGLGRSPGAERFGLNW